MATYSGYSFKLYSDVNLTTEYTGLTQLTHQTDLSDNPQDIQLWFGSTVDDITLEATSNPGVDSITITPTDGLDDWEASTAYTLGNQIEPTTPNTYYYEVTTAGTSDSSEPTWPTTIGDTVTDGTVVWTCAGKRHELTEVKLSLTSAGLDSATAGAALDIGTTLTSGVANAVEINIRVTNAVTTVTDTTSYAHILLDINEVQEVAA